MGLAAGSVVSVSGVLLDEALGAEAQLFGRRTYEFLAARWPSRSGELADRLNDMPKYVVSSTLKDPDWNNSTVLAGDVMQEVSKLKQEVDGEIVVAGSIRLVRTLMDNDLVDELHPVVLGAGERLFGETSDQSPAASRRDPDRRRPRLPHLRGRPGGRMNYYDTRSRSPMTVRLLKVRYRKQEVARRRRQWSSTSCSSSIRTHTPKKMREVESLVQTRLSKAPRGSPADAAGR